MGSEEEIGESERSSSSRRLEARSSWDQRKKKARVTGVERVLGWSRKEAPCSCDPRRKPERMRGGGVD